MPLGGTQPPDAPAGLARPVSDPDFAACMTPLGPFGPAPALVVGVSGGPHSLALALLAARWTRARGGRLLAILCDHGLRAESAAEAAGVAAVLAGQGIPARILPLGLARGPAIQDRARSARLAALLSACAAEGAPWLLLGHHRADQAETVLLRAAAGSGPSGLAAMRPARPASEALVLRPLLGVAPVRLEAVCAEAGLAPVRDPSNADPRFTRVRLRAALGDPGGATVDLLARAAEGFGGRRGLESAAIARRLAAAVLLREEGFARLDLGALGRDPVAEAALSALVRVVAGAAVPPPRQAIARLLARGEGSLAGAVLRRDGLLRREEAALAPPVPAAAGAFWDGRFRLQAALPGATLGAAGPAARCLPRPAWLPGAVVPTLPALHREGKLAAVPALAYPSAEFAARHRIWFAPVAGAAA